MSLEQAYVLNPVVCNDPEFAAQYNAAVGSMLNASACVSEDEFRDMLTSGREFEVVVFVNGAGASLRDGYIGSEGTGRMAGDIASVYISNDPSSGIKHIHDLIRSAASAWEGAG